MRQLTSLIILCLLIVKTTPIHAQTYNPDKAAEYAREWCDKVNREKYVDYSAYGGDCAAFVSQCLIAGGLSLMAGTDGNGGYVKEDSVISGVPQLIEHLAKYQNTDSAKVAGYNPLANHDVGDPMFYVNRFGLPEHSFFAVP